MKTITKNFCLVGAIIIFSLVAVGCGVSNFSYEFLVVQMTIEASRRDEPFTVDDFPELNLLSVDEILNIPNQRRFLQLRIAEPSLTNIINAASLLNQRNDVYLADPARIGSPME